MSVLDRAKHYYDLPLPHIHGLIRYSMSSFDMYLNDIRTASGSSASRSNRDALTKPEAILLLLALTNHQYEALEALPRDQLPLHVNDAWIFPDQEALFKYRLKNG